VAMVAIVRRIKLIRNPFNESISKYLNRQGYNKLTTRRMVRPIVESVERLTIRSLKQW